MSSFGVSATACLAAFRPPPGLKLPQSYEEFEWVHSWMGGRAPDQAKIWAMLQQPKMLSNIECEDKAGSADLSTVASEHDSLAPSPRSSEPSLSTRSQQHSVDGEEGLDFGSASGGDEVKVQHPTLQSHGGQMSIGSELHEAGGCVPCAFYCFKKQGCGQGAECGFCHMPHISNKKVRMQEWRKKHQLKQEGHKPRRGGVQQSAREEFRAQQPVPVMAAAASAGHATQRSRATQSTWAQVQHASQRYQQSPGMSPVAAPPGQRRQQQPSQPSLPAWLPTRQASFASTASTASTASKASPTASSTVASPSSSSQWSSTATSPVVSPAAAARGQASQKSFQSSHSGDLREPCFISMASSGCRFVSYASRGGC